MNVMTTPKRVLGATSQIPDSNILTPSVSNLQFESISPPHTVTFIEQEEPISTTRSTPTIHGTQSQSADIRSPVNRHNPPGSSEKKVYSMKKKILL
jgi:hypothetical protein